jgi:hypothetical protein
MLLISQHKLLFLALESGLKGEIHELDHVLKAPRYIMKPLFVPIPSEINRLLTLCLSMAAVRVDTQEVSSRTACFAVA